MNPRIPVKTGLLLVLYLSTDSIHCESASARPEPPSVPPYHHEHLDPVFEALRTHHSALLAIRPLFSVEKDASLSRKEIDILFPLFTYDQIDSVTKWQFAQIIRRGSSPTQSNEPTETFTLFPLLFYKAHTSNQPGYLAFFPLGGTIKNRFGREEINFVAWPLYTRTIKSATSNVGPSGAISNRAPETGIVTWNFLVPIFHVRRGPHLNGIQVWPLFGIENKQPYFYTNTFGDTELSPGHKNEFLLWPIFWRAEFQKGTDREKRFNAVLPLFCKWNWLSNSQVTVLWPIGPTIGKDRTGKVTNFELFWPLLKFSNRNGVRETRMLPIFAETVRSNSHSHWFLWPFHKHSTLETGPVTIQSDRLLFLLYKQKISSNSITGHKHVQRSLWPLFYMVKDGTNSSRLRIFAPLEPLLGINNGIERNYAPLWTIYSHHKLDGGRTNSSVWFFGLVRHQKNGPVVKRSWLFGLIQSESNLEGRKLKILYIPISNRGHSQTPKGLKCACQNFHRKPHNITAERDSRDLCSKISAN